MPSKSRRSKGGHPSHNRGQKNKNRLPAAAPRPRQVAAIHSEGSVSPPISPVVKETPVGNRYCYIGAELRRIGILAGAISVILIVLVTVLS